MINCGNTTIGFLVSIAMKSFSTKGLLYFLSDESSIIRSAAARSLHVHKNIDIDTFNKIALLASDSRAYIREIAAFTLGQLGTPEKPFRELSTPLLIKLVDDIHIDVRIASVYALGHLFFNIDMPKYVESKLITMSNDTSADIREAVIFALGYSSCSYCALDIIHRLLNDKNRNVRSEAKFFIEEILENEDSAEEYLKSMSKTS